MFKYRYHDHVQKKPRWLSANDQRTWRSFLWAARRVHESLDRQLQRDSGLPHAYYVILVTLSEAPCQHYSMTELSQHTSYSPSRLSHAITKLEQRGLVERWHPPECGRTMLAGLTAKGHEEVTTAAAGHVEQVRDIVIDRLTTEEKAQLRHLCDKILDGIDTQEDRD